MPLTSAKSNSAQQNFRIAAAWTIERQPVDGRRNFREQRYQSLEALLSAIAEQCLRDVQQTRLRGHQILDRPLNGAGFERVPNVLQFWRTCGQA